MGTHHNECLCSNKRHYEKNILTQRQLSLAECASLEAQDDMVRLDAALSKALDNGVSVNELKEAFSQLYAYTGFPRSLNALNRLKMCLMTASIKVYVTMRESRGRNLHCGMMLLKL